VPLLDEDTGVVDGLGKSKLEHLKFNCQHNLMLFNSAPMDRAMITMDDLGLQPALKEVLNLQTKNVIQFHPVIRQNTSPEGNVGDGAMHSLFPLLKLT